MSSFTLFSWPFNFFFLCLLSILFFCSSEFLGIFIRVFSPLSTLQFIFVYEILLSFFLISFLSQSTLVSFWLLIHLALIF